MRYYVEIVTIENHNKDFGMEYQYKSYKQALNKAIKESKKRGIYEVLLTAFNNDDEQVIYDSYFEGKKTFSMYQ